MEEQNSDAGLNDGWLRSIETVVLYDHVTDYTKYNDNIDVNLFQYFTRAADSSEMRLNALSLTMSYRYGNVISL